MFVKNKSHKSVTFLKFKLDLKTQKQLETNFLDFGYDVNNKSRDIKLNLIAFFLVISLISLSIHV